MSARDVAVVLVCFDGEKAAAKSRKPLERELRSIGDVVLQTTILQVSKKRKASVHDARRVLAGTLTAALTWGLFGLVAGANKIESTVIWAVLGALCGGAWANYCEHVLTKSELQRIGRKLPPGSSALLLYAETSDAATARRADDRAEHNAKPAPAHHVAARPRGGAVGGIGDVAPAASIGLDHELDLGRPIGVAGLRDLRSHLGGGLGIGIPVEEHAQRRRLIGEHSGRAVRDLDRRRAREDARG